MTVDIRVSDKKTAGMAGAPFRPSGQTSGETQRERRLAPQGTTGRRRIIMGAAGRGDPQALRQYDYAGTQHTLRALSFKRANCRDPKRHFAGWGRDTFLSNRTSRQRAHGDGYAHRFCSFFVLAYLGLVVKAFCRQGCLSNSRKALQISKRCCGASVELEVAQQGAR
jgi:hypothetical protein